MSLRHAVVLAALLPLTPAPLPAAPAGTSSAAGIEWTIPSRWTAGAARQMRVATHAVPGPKGAESGEVAVFFFGAGQGGGVDDNVARWARQFEGGPAPQRSTATVAGMRVTRVGIEGTYLAPGGPMMQSTGKKAGYRLLGAIVEAPGGNVFFRFTGPAATVAAAQAEFDALVASFRKK
jgi:hypothetical protein